MTKDNQEQERGFISIEELKARGGANPKFFELLEKYQNKNDFKEEWNEWVGGEGKNEILNFNNFYFDLKEGIENDFMAIRDEFGCLTQYANHGASCFDFSGLLFP
jgi:hypothetical protein